MGGVFNEIKSCFSKVSETDYKLVSRINTFRNDYIAHQNKELTDAVVAEKSLAPPEPELFGKARLALQGLDPKLRIPLVLKEVEEMSVEEIARTMGLTQTNVKVRLFRARKKLASILGGSERNIK